METALTIRSAGPTDLDAIREIYNEGVDDRIATLETSLKSVDEINAWFAEHDERYHVLVAGMQNHIVGWASLNRFSHRCAHSEIADLSVYVARSHRGHGVGSVLLSNLESHARKGGFHKIVLHALNGNDHGKRLYRKMGFVEVGVFREHGLLDGRYVDVVAMEKLL